MFIEYCGIDVNVYSCDHVIAPELAEFAGMYYDYDEECVVISFKDDYDDLYIPYLTIDEYKQLEKEVRDALSCRPYFTVKHLGLLITDIGEDILSSYYSIDDYIEKKGLKERFQSEV